MKRIAMVTGFALALAGLLVTAMGGMSWLDSLGLRGQAKLVENRVEGYWQARVDGDMDRMVEYLHPLQGTVAEPGMLVTQAYEITGVEVDGDQAVANLTVQSRLKHPILSSRERTVDLATKWVRYEGKWYVDVMPVGFHQLIKNHKGEWQAPTQPPAQP